MNESPSVHDDPPMADEVDSEDMPENFGVPWITYVVIAVCGVIFAYFNLAAEAPAFETVTGTLAPSALEIWAGSYWGLITTAFVHIGFWHIAFNMWWAKDFGAVLEPAMGRGRYLIFILLARYPDNLNGVGGPT